MNQKTVFTFPKRGRGRPKKIYAEGEQRSLKKVGLSAVIEPTCHDLKEELSMLDSYTYARYNQ